MTQKKEKISKEEKVFLMTSIRDLMTQEGEPLLDIHQSKPMRVNMKEPADVEPMKKIDE